MKMMKKKPILALALLALLLTIAVSGTLAYLKTSTLPVINTFEPTQVSVTVNDKVEGTTKKEVVIKNTSNVYVYIRAAIVGNWQTSDGTVVAEWTNSIPNEATPLGVGWFKGSDGYYYYSFPVAPGAELKEDNENELFKSYEAPDAPTNSFGVTADLLQLDILVQAIQAEGVNGDGEHPVELAWGVTVNENGTPNDYSDDTISAPSGN